MLPAASSRLHCGPPGVATSCSFRRGCSPLLADRHRSRGRQALQAAAGNDAQPKVLLVGVTGVTGRSAFEGLLSGGMDLTKALVLTRNAASPTAAAFQARGAQVVTGNLDDEGSLLRALEGVEGLYCHALSKDAAVADPQETARALRLARCAAQAGVKHLVYNGSGARGAGARFGITQMQQKHDIEQVFLSAGLAAGATCLGATLFMEEWWKRYTRPQILKGTFPFSLPGDRPVQLVAARDIGLAAAVALQQPKSFANRSIEVAGDELTPQQMCAAFAAAQGAPVRHSRPPAWLFWLLGNKDLFNIIRFLEKEGFHADVAACRATFPGMLSFAEFLQASHWADPSRTYEDGIGYDLPALLTSDDDVQARRA